MPNAAQQVLDVVQTRRKYPRTSYPTDLTEQGWSGVRQLFGRDDTNLRQLVNATLFRLTFGVPLRKLPPDLPPWGSVHAFEYRLVRTGLIKPMLAAAGRSELEIALPHLFKNMREIQ